MHWTLFILVILFFSYVSEGYYSEFYSPSEDNQFTHLDDYDDDDALAVFKNVQKKSYRRRLICRRWNQHCVPWTNKPFFKCCSDLTCKCNLWMQNCRCVSKLWGR
ncbi:hypothetical protein ACF0H5_007722 [Mactra antiquata]